MSADIVFIKNINDYNEYSKIKPVRYRLNSKVKFICSCCGNESIKCFKSLTTSFLCKICQNRQAQLRNSVKLKKKQTNLEKYGVENTFQSNEKKNIIKQTCLQKYGVENPHQNKEIIEKTKETCFKRFGYSSPAKAPEIKQKIKNACLERYGVDNYVKTKEYKIKTHNTLLKRYNKDSLYSSKSEKSLYDFIKLNYNGIIIQDDRDILNGKELDIYLPDIGIAFEYDGTYWHADDRFYNEADMIRSHKVYDIWQKDKEKDLLCEKLGIILVRIKEYDWINNNDYENQRILDILYNYSLQK